MKCFSMVMSDILKFSVGIAGSEDYIIAWNYTKTEFSVSSRLTISKTSLE
jgi:hypothetical protein